MKYKIRKVKGELAFSDWDTLRNHDIVELEPLDCPASECDYMKKARIESMLALQNVYPRQEDTKFSPECKICNPIETYDKWHKAGYEDAVKNCGLVKLEDVLMIFDNAKDSWWHRRGERITLSEYIREAIEGMKGEGVDEKRQ